MRSLTVAAGAGFGNCDCLLEEARRTFGRRRGRTGCAALEVAETVDIGSATHRN